MGYAHQRNVTATMPQHMGGVMADLTEQAVARFGDRLALIDDVRAITYAQIGEFGSQYEQVFRHLGLRRGNSFAMLVTSRADCPAIVYAGQAIGMRYTPLHPLGSLEDHAYILQDAEIDLLIVDETTFLEHGAELAQRVPTLKVVVPLNSSALGEGLFQRAARFTPGKPPKGAQNDDIAGISYTGGTTGTPKGVVHTHRSFLAAVLLELAIWEWPKDVRFLSATPLSHATAMILPPVLVRGGTFFIHDRFDPIAFFETIQRERITATFLVPTMIYRLLDHPRLNEFDLSSLQMIIYGAAPISPTRLTQAIDVFGPVFCQLYGQTEAPQILTYLSKADHDPQNSARLASCGTPVPSLQVEILNSEGEICKVGEIGEICARGPLVMEGYWKRPAETASVLRGGWLHTSDMARRDKAGYITIVDRARDMVISGGFNVYPAEVEAALMSHPAVAHAAVIGIPDPKWGEAVAAFVRLGADCEANEAELIAHVRQLKGSVQAPKLITFVNSLPETAVGKVDKKVLRESFWENQARQVS
jgi:fatty-acyl-CoA synthase